MSESRRMPGTLVSIQILRGLAALLVVIHHAITFFNDKYAANFVEFDLGAIGVDIFFVISGFIMFWTTRTHDGSWQDTVQFWKKRAVRVMPLYWLITLSLAAVLLFFPSLFKSMQLSIVWLLKSLFFIPYLNEVNLPHPMVDPGWTLNYEMFFYLVIGACLSCGRRHATMMCVAMLASAVLAGVWLNVDDAVFATYTSPLLLEFCAGMICGALYQRFGIYNPGVGLSLLILVTCWLGLAQPGFPGSDLHRAALWGGASVVIVLSVLSLEGLIVSAKYLTLPKLLGDASYSIYLVHTLFFLAFGKLAGFAGGGLLFMPELFVVWAVIFGVITYRLIEKPLGRVTNRMIMRQSYSFAATARSGEAS